MTESREQLKDRLLNSLRTNLPNGFSFREVHPPAVKMILAQFDAAHFTRKDFNAWCLQEGYPVF